MVTKLTAILNPILKWNKAGTDPVSSFICSLIMVRTVNLSEIAAAMPGKAVQNSKYIRLKRFFAGFEVCCKSIAVLIVRMIPISDDPWDISMDRTNWKFGKKNINPPVMGIVHPGVVFPLRWTTFSKRGNSNTKERMSLIDWFAEVFGVHKIRCLYADREFIGEKRPGYLLEKKIRFRIRIRADFMVTDSGGQQVPVSRLFRDLKPNQYRILEGRRLINGLYLHVVGMMPADGKYLIPVTDADPGQALENYKKSGGSKLSFNA